MIITFTIEGCPVPKDYGYKARGFFKKKNVREWEAVVSSSAMVAARKVSPAFKFGAHLGPVKIAMTFYLPIPKSDRHVKDGDIHCRKSKGDVTNLYKSSEDGLKGVLFLDDGQVYQASLCKMYGDTPRTEIFVELVDYDK